MSYYIGQKIFSQANEQLLTSTVVTQGTGYDIDSAIKMSYLDFTETDYNNQYSVTLKLKIPTSITSSNTINTTLKCFCADASETVQIKDLAIILPISSTGTTSIFSFVMPVGYTKLYFCPYGIDIDGDFEVIISDITVKELVNVIPLLDNYSSSSSYTLVKFGVQAEKNSKIFINGENPISIGRSELYETFDDLIVNKLQLSPNNFNEYRIILDYMYSME